MISPIVIHKSGAYAYKWKHEVHAEEMSLDEFFAAVSHPRTPHASDVHIHLTSEKI